MRRCAIGHGCFVPPLSVSGPRGVAALCTDSMRIQTLDLEDHQEVEEAEGAEMTDCYIGFCDADKPCPDSGGAGRGREEEGRPMPGACLFCTRGSPAMSHARPLPLMRCHASDLEELQLSGMRSKELVALSESISKGCKLDVILCYGSTSICSF